MKKTVLAASVLALLPMASHADLLFTVGAKASVWGAEPTGQVDDGISVDGEQNGLGMDSENGNQITLFFEHPVPVLPNIRVRQTSLDMTGNGFVVTEFDDQTFTGDVSSKMDISHTDLTLYWGLPIPVPFFDFNFGLTGRTFDGQIYVKDETTSEVADVPLDFTLPMGFAEVQVETPFGIYGQVEVNYIGYDGNSLSDWVYGVGYDLPVPVIDLGIEAGYRSMKVETNDDTTDIATDFEVSGMYYGASLAFGF
ncbi:MAG TPA: hypothetical protein DEA26_04705 [Oceanospirillales bacterium]|nr:hypothetical protein [Oceanospirillaceae bacterium]HBS41958.1 hypothetical protein [Oceanospirillales bacterium]|tara:strand:+ start:7664 stop:8422 length:759 start_codon:yes stop_codon:yes gene_type:complete